jgi:phosphoribosylformylglycinamidine synthase subunit PurQ / glutaminase
VLRAVELLGGSARLVFHAESAASDCAGFIVPGGFAHGDYLRPGAIARFSPVMGAVTRLAERGGPVLGICNGFQVLTESGLLPGALLPNVGQRFLCTTVRCRVETERSVLTGLAAPGQVLALPINHYEGNFTCSEEQLATLEASGQVVLRYCENLNGSMAAIAGVTNATGNVVGLMPHPERASHELLGSTDGKVLLASFLDATRRYADG